MERSCRRRNGRAAIPPRLPPHEPIEANHRAIEHLSYTDSIAERYGRKKAWMLHVYTSLLAATGRYERFARIRWSEVGRFVFVCKGNICRSPYCERRAHALGVSAVSRGLEAGSQGSTPTSLVAAAASRGLDLSRHQPARFRSDELETSDLVIAMEPDQATQVERAIKPGGAQVTLLGIWHSKPRPYIQDPFGMSTTYVENCLQLMDACTEQLTRMLTTHGKSN